MRRNTLNGIVDLFGKWVAGARSAVRKLAAAFCELERLPAAGIVLPLESLVSSLKHVRSTGSYTRDEVNQR